MQRTLLGFRNLKAMLVAAALESPMKADARGETSLSQLKCFLNPAGNVISECCSQTILKRGAPKTLADRHAQITFNSLQKLKATTSHDSERMILATLRIKVVRRLITLGLLNSGITHH